MWAATQAPHEVRMFLARLLGHRRTPGASHHARHRRRLRPEGPAHARGHVRRLGRGEASVRRSNGSKTAGRTCSRRAWDATSTADARMAFDDDGRIVGAYIDHVQDVGAYPTPWPVGTAAAVGMLFPGPYRVPQRWIPHDIGLLEHHRTRRLPGTVAVRVSGTRSAPRHRRRVAWGSIRSNCGAATCCEQDELPCRNPNGMPYSDITPTGHVRAGAVDARLRGLSARASGGACGRSVSRSRHVHVRRTDDDRDGVLRDRGCDDSHRAVRQDQRLRRRWVDREQPRDCSRAARRRCARRRHRRRPHRPGRHRAHPLRCRHGR